ncbi:hypothetical protein HY256_03400 [Candidatus Sumerlaeota bacterium]|nr:hypothetical protein [Candidatus Sumerlaeota bacterium]
MNCIPRANPNVKFKDFAPLPTRMQTWTCLRWAAALVLLRASVPFSAHAEDPDLLALLPTGVETVVVIPDIQSALGSFREGAFGEFYRNPRSEEFLRPLRETLEQDSRELAALLDDERNSLRSSLKGEFVVARLSRSESPGKHGKESQKSPRAYVVLFRHDADAQTIREIIEPKPRPGERYNRIESQSSNFAYTRIQLFRETIDKTYDSKHVPKKGRHESLLSTPDIHHARGIESRDEFIYSGPNLAIRACGEEAVMTEILKRLRSHGKLPSLDKLDRFDGAMRPFETPPAIEVYYDFFALTHGGKPLINESLLGRGGDISKLGLDEIKSGGLGIYFGKDRLTTQMNVFIPKPRNGVGNLLFINEPLAAGSGAKIEAMIPQDALGYTLFSADLSQIWGESRRIFAAGVPAASELLDSWLKSLREGMDADIEADLTSKLGRHWGMFTRASSVRGTKKKLDTTYLIEIREGADLRPTLDRWLKKTAETLNYKLDQSDVGENHFYRLNGADVSEGSFADIEQFAKVCLTPRWLIVSPRFEHIQAALDRMTPKPNGPSPNPKLARAEQDRAASIAGLPGDRFMEIYAPPASFGSFSKDPFLGIFGGVFGGIGGSVVEFDKAPKDEVWNRYFGPACGSIRSGEDHLEIAFELLYREPNP